MVVDREDPMAALSEDAVMTVAETTAGMSFVPDSAALQGILTAPTAIATIFGEPGQEAAVDVGTATDTGSLPLMGQIPFFLEYRAPDGVAGNIVQRFEWGYFDPATATLGGTGTIDRPDNFVRGGVIDIYVVCAPGYRSSRPAVVEEATVWDCEPCPAGYFNLDGVTDQTECFPCPPGQYSEPGTSGGCQLCPLNTYAESEATAECTVCPGGMTTVQEGTASVDECQCDPGTFRHKDRRDECQPCDDAGGALCTQVNQRIPLPAAAGIHIDPVTGAPFPCVLDEACPRLTNEEDVEAGLCGTGYKVGATGGCDDCVTRVDQPPGWYRSGQQCKKCKTYTALFVVAGVIVLLFLTPLLMKLAQKNVFGSINIFVVFFQTTVIFKELNWEWPQELLDLYESLSFFNLNIELVSPECFVGDFSSLHKIWIGVSCPGQCITSRLLGPMDPAPPRRSHGMAQPRSDLLLAESDAIRAHRHSQWPLRHQSAPRLSSRKHAAHPCLCTPRQRGPRLRAGVCEI